jgi:hypothetical protein
MTPSDLQKLPDLELLRLTQKYMVESSAKVRASHIKEASLLLGEYARRMAHPYTWMGIYPK